MKLILRADIENLGSLGELVVVKAGYARNYLLPQQLAMAATPANIKMFELERKKLQAQMDALRTEASAIADRLANLKVLTIPMRVGENDKLYGSVTNSLVAERLAEEGIVIDKRRILIDAPIRNLGAFEVRVRLHTDIVANLPLQITDNSGRVIEEEPVQAPKEAPQDA